MDTVLLELDQAEARDPLRAGAKAATLATLLGAGLPVPAGYVIATNAFGAGGSGAADLPEPVRAALREISGRWGDEVLAVRSSAVAEDRPDASFAGLYETVLGVRGPAALAAAVRRCWASADHDRVAAYRSGPRVDGAAFAVLVQRLVQPDAAGVAFGADPVTGERGVVVVSAVAGHAARLVGGEVEPEVWRIRAAPRLETRHRTRILTNDQARRVAVMVRRIESQLGQPTDLEWAIVGDALLVLQARPMTALPDEVAWPPPKSGGWSRSIRLGEWLPEPVTPLFATWLLDRLEHRFGLRQASDGGVRAPGPLHVIVNGWYFHSPIGGGGALTLVGGLVRRPRLAVATVLASRRPDIADRLAFAEVFRDWPDRVLDRYRRRVQEAEDRVRAARPAELVRIVDDLGDAAGDFLWSLVLCGGAAWRAEVALARFCRRHVQGAALPPYQALLGGLVEPVARPHAVHSLDWIRPTLGESASNASEDEGESGDSDPVGPGRAVRERGRAELAYRQALAGRPRRLARFERLLRAAQTYAALRAEHSAWFTLPWPVLRRSVARLGEELMRAGILDRAEDVYFLDRAELDAGLAGRAPVDVVAERRRTWERQRRLVPPLHMGRSSVLLSKLLLGSPRFMRGPRKPGTATLNGIPAGPGRARGPIRVLHDLTASSTVLAGEILVVRAAPPAIAPLFNRIAALCVDGGSVAAHASIVAREYGLPVVVGLGDATARLSDGDIATVDGEAGTVHIGQTTVDPDERSG